jgi:septal ring factor EnvC (AmiA/AmiB activator)
MSTLHSEVYYIENNGVDFKTEPGASARAVFDGNVISIFYLPTTQNCVIVKHGEYFSVYSNIASPSVKVGDNVSTKQSL